MKKLILALVATLTLWMPAAPAHAGDGYWSPTTCGNMMYYGVPGSGAWYYRYADNKYHWLDGDWWQKYAGQGWECGGLGEPIGGVMMMDYAGGPTYSGISPGHGCGRFACSSTLAYTNHIHFVGGCIISPLATWGSFRVVYGSCHS